MKRFFISMILVLPFIAMMSCSNDDDSGSSVEVSETFVLYSVTDPSISGTAKVIKNDNTSITVELQLTGTTSGAMHPAHIHYNSAAESGGVAVTLGTVDGNTGFSTVTFTKLDNDTAITYEELLEFDGYINVHLSAAEPSILVAQGDIGINVLTGESILYDLTEVDVPNVSGTVTFFQRVSGKALAEIKLNNTVLGETHPAFIRMNDVATGGSIIFTFNPVNGETGISTTHVTAFDDDTPFNYSDVATLDGHVSVHMSALDMVTLIAQGNIGINDFE